jgi:hypothetical protein
MKTMTLPQLEQAVTLTGDLSHDLQSHVAYYYHVASGNAQAQAAVEEMKYQLLCKEAELQEAIRDHAAKINEKVTEALITSRIKAHPEYTALYTHVLGAHKEAGEWSALQKAFESRGYILHDLVLLSTKGVDGAGISDYTKLREASATVRRQLKQR